MSSNFVLAIFDPAVAGYEADRGIPVPGLKFRFRDPGDIDVAAVLAAVGARLRLPTDGSQCPTGFGFDPRKLKFTRVSGNSFQIPAPIHAFANISGYVTAIAAAVGTADPVQCVDLIGEKWDDLMPELSTRTAAPTPGTDPSTLGKKGIYSASYFYLADSVAGSPLIKVKADTDSPPDLVNVNGQPPSIVAAEWATCMGTATADSKCPGARNLDHRRYIGTYLVNRNIAGGVQEAYAKIEIPEAGGTGATILACGQAIANNASIACLAYKGESAKNLQRQIAIV